MAAIVTVVETVTFVAQAKGRMTDEERYRAIDMIAADPECGVLISGGGGLRKVRFGIGGRGKRGGVRNRSLLSESLGAGISAHRIRQE